MLDGNYQNTCIIIIAIFIKFISHQEKIYHQIREKINLNSAVNLMKMVNKASSECYSISKKHVKLLMVEATGFFLMLKALVFKVCAFLLKII